MNHYYATPEGQVVGPLSLAELEQMRAHGLLPESALICAEGETEWRPLNAFLPDEAVPSARVANPAGETPCDPRPITAESILSSGVRSPEQRSNYQRVAETIGMIPDLNLRRNLLQLVIVVAVTLGCFLTGWLFRGAFIGLMAGLVGVLFGVIISGAVLMVLGWRNRV